MIKTVIFDIDNTLYDYDSAHLFGMEALTAYCIKEFHISEQQIRSCYDKAMKIMAKRIGTDSAAIHSRMLRFQCMTELLSQPLFPHVENMYHAYWDTMIANAKPSPGILKVLEELKTRHIRIGIGTDMTASIQFKKLKNLDLIPILTLSSQVRKQALKNPIRIFLRSVWKRPDALRIPVFLLEII